MFAAFFYPAVAVAAYPTCDFLGSQCGGVIAAKEQNTETITAVKLWQQQLQLFFKKNEGMKKK